MDKFDSKLDEAIYLGYSTTSKTFRVFNKRRLTVEESVHVAFDESNDVSSKTFSRNGDVDIEANMKNLEITQGEGIFEKES